MQNSLAAVFFRRATELGSSVAVRFKEGRGPYRDLSWALYSQMVEEMAFGLATMGLEPGRCAAILSNTSHLWVAADLSIISAGAVSVPIYPTSSHSDVEFIVNNSEAAFLFVQNESLLKKVLDSRSTLPHLKKIILLSPLSNGKSLSELAVEPGLVIGLEELQQAGRERLLQEPDLIVGRIENTGIDDLATIIYTSGTTGTPKGAMLTHSNVLSVMEALRHVLPVTKDDTYLSFLPLSHVFERVCGEFYWMHSGGVCAFAEGIEHLPKNLAEVQPTMILVVPRVLDKIYSKVKSGIEGASGRARKLIEWALAVGKQVVQLKAEGKQLDLPLALKFWVAQKLVLNKLRNRIGSRLRLVVSGGAPATREVIEFFNIIGITTLEGYGLTETTAPASVNRSDLIKPGTVGPAIPCVELKIADDGEILIKGASVFKGYFKNDEATAEAFENEWFRSGDIGTIDGDGYLKITDRKKDIIVNVSGKNIAPQKLEAILKTIPLVTQAIVFGDKRKYLVALLTLDEHATIEFARDRGWQAENFQQASQLRELNKFIRQEIDKRVAPLADYERVRKFAILPNDLSVEAGELTATLKIKRGVVAQNYKSLVQSMYRDEEGALVGARRDAGGSTAGS